MGLKDVVPSIEAFRAGLPDASVWQGLAIAVVLTAPRLARAIVHVIAAVVALVTKDPERAARALKVIGTACAERDPQQTRLSGDGREASMLGREALPPQ